MFASECAQETVRLIMLYAVHVLAWAQRRCSGSLRTILLWMSEGKLELNSALFPTIYCGKWFSVASSRSRLCVWSAASSPEAANLLIICDRGELEIWMKKFSWKWRICGVERLWSISSRWDWKSCFSKCVVWSQKFWWDLLFTHQNFCK